MMRMTTPRGPLLERFELDDSFETFAPPPPADGPDLEESAEDRTAAPVVQLADRILVRALASGASDIHIEPQEQGLKKISVRNW